MPWNETIRKRYERIPMGYSSDVIDGQWTVVSRLLPGRNRLAHPRKGALRDIWNAIRYIAASGCAWSLLPKDFPPVSTVRCYFHRWRDNGLLHEVNRALAAMARCAQSRSGSPTGGVIDSVRTTENTSLSGFHAGRKIKGRKRHIMTDTCGRLLALCVHPANIQDRDGASGVFARLRREAPKLREALIGIGRWTIGTVKRSDTAKGFEVLPRRWGVERTFAWLPQAGRRLGTIHRKCKSMGPYRTYQTHDTIPRNPLKSPNSFPIKL